MMPSLPGVFFPIKANIMGLLQNVALLQQIWIAILGMQLEQGNGMSESYALLIAIAQLIDNQ